MAVSAFRTDIQLLRAVAVGLVILDHATLLQRLPGNPLGGFIGVDIFFVISGYLITSQLVRERLSTGKISFREFYVRRARRILPMAVLVVVTVVLASFAIFLSAQANRYAVDGLWSLLFVSNVAFSLNGTDYFASSAPSIFQHFWSLSVEEQFYIFWPLVILVGGWAASKRSNPRRSIAVVAIVVGTISFVWAIVETTVAPLAAYFSTPARAFEFAAGAVLAILAGNLTRLPRSVRLPLALVGLTGLAASAWLITPDAGFPGPMALLPVLCTVLVIAAGTGLDGGLRIPVLTSKPVNYLGSISYSLYLWHWPAIVVALALIPSSSLAVGVALLATLLLSAMSYRFVEQAVLKSTWLRPGKAVPGAVLTGVRNAGAMALGIVLVVGVVAVGVTVSQRAAAATAAQSIVLQGGEPSAATPIVGQLQRDIAASAGTNAWDQLEPPISDLGPIYPGSLSECWTERTGEFATCERGDPAGQQVVVLYGDSIAMTYAPAVELIAKQQHLALHIFAKPGCPVAELSVLSTDGSVYDQCDAFRLRAQEEIRELDPDLILVTSALEFKSAPGVTGSTDRLRELGWTKSVNRLSSVAPVAVLTPPVSGPEVAVCATRFNGPDGCGTAVSKDWAANLDLLSVVGRDHSATVINTAVWSCSLDGECPAVIDGTVVRRDRTHFTIEYSQSLAPVLGAWIASLLQEA